MFLTQLIAVLLIIVGLLVLALPAPYLYLPAVELKRRAARGDRYARALAGPAAHSDELQLLALIVAITCLAGGLFMLARVAPVQVLPFAFAVALGLALLVQRGGRVTKTGVRVATWCAPAALWVLVKLEPVMSHPAQWFAVRLPRRPHSDIFERDDLVTLVDHQAKQFDNRIDAALLKRIRQVMDVDYQTVAAHMTPKNEVAMVNATDTITPVLVSELHNTGHEYFPVYEGSKTNIIGTLSLSRIADTKQHGSIGANIDRHLAYLNQNDTLIRAVRAYYETHQPLFIVVDQHEKYIGILTVGNILNFLFGSLEAEAFGSYDDRVSVAKKGSSQDPTEVVE